jgi:preprotein translocase subunit SecB
MTETATDTTPRFAMRGQYIKDLSFENPRAPVSLMGSKEAPKVELNLDLQAQRIDTHLYELSMVIKVNASSEEPLFVLELEYAGLFELVNIPAELMERVLLVDSAFTLFPFARRIVADATRDGGFPPLILEPIDFVGLFELRKAQAEAERAPAEAAIN